MKKQILILLAILASVFSYGQGGFTPISKLRLTTTPAVDNTSTQVLVRDSSTGNVGYVSKTTLMTSPTLQEVHDEGNTITNGTNTTTLGNNGISTTDGTDSMNLTKLSLSLSNGTDDFSVSKSSLEFTNGTDSFSASKTSLTIFDANESITLNKNAFGIISYTNELNAYSDRLSIGDGANESVLYSDRLLLGDGTNQSNLYSDRISLEDSTNSASFYVDKITINGNDYNFPTGIQSPIATISDIGTGFETAYLNTTQSITASTDTVIDITGSAQTSNGGLDLINLTTDAITPYNVGDVITVDVAMPFTTPAGTSNYVTLILRVKTTGQVYRAFTHSMLKGSGNTDYLATSWTVPINADAQTNGLELVVNSNVNFTINEKFISVTRTHKAQ